MLNRKGSPVEAAEIEDFLKNKPLNFRAILDKRNAYVEEEYVISATPINYDPETNCLNIQSIESVIYDVIIANRRSSDLDDVSEKIYTRDLFGHD